MRKLMLRPAAAATLIVLTLAGCDKKETADSGKGDAAPAQAAPADVGSGGDMGPRAGLWETRIVLEKVDMPGKESQMTAMMNKAQGKERMGTNCLTPEQAKTAGKGALFKQTAPGCSFEKFDMAGGKIDASLHCVNQMGDRTTTMVGTYGADAYQLRVTNSGKMEGGQAISTSMAISARRIGECTPDSKAPAYGTPQETP